MQLESDKKWFQDHNQANIQHFQKKIRNNNIWTYRQKYLIVLIITFNFFIDYELLFVKSQAGAASIPSQRSTFVDFQTFSSQFVLRNVGNSTFYVPFNQTKRVPPTTNSMCFAFDKFGSDINFLNTTDNTYKLFVAVSASNISLTGFTFLIENQYFLMDILSVRFLVWNSYFAQGGSFMLLSGVFYPSGQVTGSATSNMIFNLYAWNYTQVQIIHFPISMRFQSLTTHIQFNQTHGVGPNLTSFRSKFIAVGDYKVVYVKYLYLIVQKSSLIGRGAQVTALVYRYDVSNPSYLSKRFTYTALNPYAYIMYGMIFFSYDTQNNSPGLYDFTLNSSVFSNYTELTFNSQLSKLRYDMLILTFIDCKNQSYPLIFINRTNWKYECYNMCLDGYFLAFSYQTYRCWGCHFTCLTCDWNPTCITCKPQYDLVPNRTCQLKNIYFRSVTNGSIYYCNLSSNLSQCLECDQNGTICSKCNVGYYINGSQFCQLCSSFVPYCTECDNDTCFACQPPYYLLNSTLCGTAPAPVNNSMICADSSCESCQQTNISNCVKCYESALKIVNGKCVINCGDGIVSSLEVCDDGNTLDFDGCSSTCTAFQQNFICFNTFNNPATSCYFSQQINLSVVSIKKIDKQNRVVIVLKNPYPNIYAWSYFTQNTLKKILEFRIPRVQNTNQSSYVFDYKVRFLRSSEVTLKRRLQSAFSPEDKTYIELSVSYTALSSPSLSLNNLLSSIEFSPHLSNLSIFNYNSGNFTAPSLVQFNLVQDSNTIIQYYPQSYYQNCKIMTSVSLLLSILTIGMEISSNTITQQIIITIETVGVIQFVYFALIGIGPLNPMFVSMEQGIKYTSGYDIALSTEQSKIKSLMNMDILSYNISNNVNMSLLIPLIFIVAGFVYSLFEKKTRHLPVNDNNHEPIEEKINDNSKQEEYKKLSPQENTSQVPLIRSKKLIINFGFCLFVFFLYKYAFYMLIQLKYASIEMIGIVIMGLVAAMIIFFVILIVAKFQLFKQVLKQLSVDKKLDQQNLKIFKIYFMMFILQRVLNVSVVVVLSSVVFNELGPILIYILKLIFIYKKLSTAYHQSQILRLYLTYLIGMIMQVLLFVRRCLLESVVGIEGGQQLGYGVYLPYSVMILMYLVVISGIIFETYSIKRFRCCQLEIQWQKNRTLMDPKKIKQKLDKLQIESIKKDKNTEIDKKEQKIDRNMNIYQNSKDKDLNNINRVNLIESDVEEYLNKKQEQIQDEPMEDSIHHNLLKSKIQNGNQLQNNSRTKQLNNQRNDQIQNGQQQRGFNTDKVLINASQIKKQIKHELQKMKLTKKRNNVQDNIYNSSKRIKKLVSQEQSQSKQSLINSKSDYKYTNLNKYYIGDEFDMI